MKKLLALLVALFLLASCSIACAKSVQTAFTVKITATCADYNHVGNDWSYQITLNGKDISSLKTANFKAGDKITIESRVEEHDGKPDVGTQKTTYTVTESDLKKGITIAQKVKVTENGGRYRGRSCTWNIKVKLSPKK